jgi:hypothetical protein
MLEPGEGEAVEVARRALAPKSQTRRYWKLIGHPDGTLAVMRDTGNNKAMLIGVAGDTLVKLDTLPCKMEVLRRRGELVFVENPAMFVLDGVDELLAQAIEKADKKPRAKPAT